MAERLTDAEKKKLIEDFISKNKDGFLLVKSLGKCFPGCSEDTLRKWTKELYGKTPSEFFTERGVLVCTTKGKTKFVNKVFEQLKAASTKGKLPYDLYAIQEAHPDILIEDLSWIAQYEENIPFDYSRLFTEGVLSDPYDTDEKIKAFAEKSLWLKNDHVFFGYEQLKEELNLRNSSTSLLGKHFIDYVLDKYPRALGMTAEEYYVTNEMLFSEEERQKEIDKCITKLTKAYATKKPADSKYSVAYKAKKYNFTDVIEYLTREEMKKGLTYNEAENNVLQVFIDANIIEGKKSEKAKAALANSNAKKSEKEHKKTNVYEKLDTINVETLAKKAGIETNDKKKFPKDEKYTVTINGKTFFVNIKLKRSFTKKETSEIFGFDGIKALHNMLSSDEVMEREDPNNHTGEYFHPEFMENFKNDSKLVEKRMLFINSIGAMLSSQEGAELIVDFAPKKKDGSFHKRRNVQIASSMIATYPFFIYQIVGKTESDDTISVFFDWSIVTPENYEKSMDDLVSSNWDFFNR